MKNEPNLTISKKQREILYLLYRYRFLTTPHIQYLLNHKEPRRIKAWTRDLYDKQLINRIYKREFGSEAKPAIYYLNKKAIPTLRGMEEVNVDLLRRIYREPHRTRRFIDRCLYFMEFYKFMRKFATERGFKLTYYTKVDLEDFDFMIRPLPDACIVLVKDAEESQRYLVELFDEGMPRRVIKHRMVQYTDYYSFNDWEDATGYEFPFIMCLAGNVSRERFLKKAAKQINEDECEDVEFVVMSKEWIKD